MTDLLISDLHLSETRPAITERFLLFLRDQAPAADTLYILGDLFDAWVGDDSDDVLARSVRSALRAASGSTRILLQHGNRDFLIGEDFAAATGIQLIPDEWVVSLGGVPTLLMHGDLLCTRDRDYLQARAMLRDPAFIADFLSKPLPQRIAIAREYRARSGEATSLKAEDIMDVTPEEVLRQLRRHGVNHLVHGHTHRQARHPLDLDGQPAERWVLGDWREDAASALQIEGRDWQFVNLP
jgi:UDP-2,3-diacylglucosamine hydrolase